MERSCGIDAGSQLSPPGPLPGGRVVRDPLVRGWELGAPLPLAAHRPGEPGPAAEPGAEQHWALAVEAANCTLGGQQTGGGGGGTTFLLLLSSIRESVAGVSVRLEGCAWF